MPPAAAPAAPDASASEEAPAGPVHPESPEASGALVDEAFLLRALRDVVDRRILHGTKGGSARAPSAASTAPCSPASPSDSDGAEGEEGDELDKRLETLWDLCVDEGTAAFVASHSGVAVLSRAAEQGGSEGRTAEICLGTLANTCAHHALVEGITADDLAQLRAAALRGLRSPDARVVLQALRLACALLCGPAARACPDLWDDASISGYVW
ncbi:unnamed protein product, partial [Prorocentrum cordatum]